MNRTNAEGQSLLIKNGQIFDGVSDRLRAGHVLISERTIAAIDASPIAESDSMTVIDGAGRVLMPGMTDAHVHLVGMANTLMDLPMASQSQLAAATRGLLPARTQGQGNQIRSGPYAARGPLRRQAPH
jgi:imidazolonepropionase-like amidohydrolase